MTWPRWRLWSNFLMVRVRTRPQQDWKNGLLFFEWWPRPWVIEANSSDGRTLISNHDFWACWQEVDKTDCTVGGGGSLRVRNKRGVAVVGFYANNRLVYLTAMAIGAGFNCLANQFQQVEFELDGNLIKSGGRLYRQRQKWAGDTNTFF